MSFDLVDHTIKSITNVLKDTMFFERSHRYVLTGGIHAERESKSSQLTSKDKDNKSLCYAFVSEEHRGRLEHAINCILSVYQLKGVLQADDTLDAMIESDVGEHESLRDLQRIFHAEMGIQPSKDDSVAHSPPKIKPVRDIFHAIYYWSRAIQLFETNHSEAQHLAEIFVKIAERPSELPPEVPQSWVDQASKMFSLIHPGNSSSFPEMKKTHSSAEILKIQEDFPAMTALMSMIGMGQIKQEFINMCKRSQLAEKQDNRHFSFNARFEGKRGTGKRTVAQHYALLLRQMKILPEKSIFIEVSGAKLSSGGIDDLRADLLDIKKAGGGAFLIHDPLVLTEDTRGRQVLSHLLSLCRNKSTSYGDIVWILACDPREMQKLIDQSPVLLHRFPNRFHFHDFTNDELMQIFQQNLRLPRPVKNEWMDSSRYPCMVDYKGDSWYSLSNKIWKDEVGSTMTSMPLKKPKEKFTECTMTTPDGVKWTLQPKKMVWVCDYHVLPDYPSRFLASNKARMHEKFSHFDKGKVFNYNGMKWVLEGAVWRDMYGGSCTHHPKEGFIPGKTLQTEDGRHWIQQVKLTWTCDSDGQLISLDPSGDWARLNGQAGYFRCERMQYARMAINRLGKRRSGASFGNASAVQAYYATVRARQAARVAGETSRGTHPDILLLTREDLLGPQVIGERIRCGPAYKKLLALEGLLPVKKAVDALIDLVAVNAKREEAGQPLLDVVLNKVFLGNPGTGKTTVARIYGQLLAEMGLLSKGDVILKTASDFVGDVLGSSESTTRDILKAAEGCVLVIDEAYGLYSSDGNISGGNSYSRAVINTIVEQVQAEAGEDRAVLLLGYRADMERMMRNSNPGLARRFQLENAFEFPDYSDFELLRILVAKAKACGLSIEAGVAKRAVAMLARARAKPNFGNAGEVENLLSEAKTKLAVGEDILSLQAFGITEKDSPNLVQGSELDDMVGCNSVKRYLSDLRDTIEFAHSRGDDPRDHVNYNFLFLGNPGTGKTTVARRMGRIFRNLGLLAEDRVTEVSASDLVTGYTGQAGKRTKEVFESSCGGVLLVDEAYQLDPKRGGSYMTEVIDEIVRCMTVARFKANIVVIFSGYAEPIMQMLEVNKGLSSRFPERLFFDNLDAKETLMLLELKLREKQLKIKNGPEEELIRLASILVECPDFANGRDVINWCNLIFREYSKAQAQSKRKLKFVPGCNPGTSAYLDGSVELQQVKAALSTLKGTMLASSRSLDGDPGTDRKISAQPQINEAFQEASMSCVAPLVTCKAQMGKIMDHGLKIEDECHSDQSFEILPAQNQTFDQVDSRVLEALQNLLWEMGLNSEEGVKSVLDDFKGERVLENMMQRLVEGGMSQKEAELGLYLWKRGQEDLQLKLKEVEIQRRMGRIPIWRCAVCGRADKPWIECWVAPFIVAYENA